MDFTNSLSTKTLQTLQSLAAKPAADLSSKSAITVKVLDVIPPSGNTHTTQSKPQTSQTAAPSLWLGKIKQGDQEVWLKSSRPLSSGQQLTLQRGPGQTWQVQSQPVSNNTGSSPPKPLLSDSGRQQVHAAIRQLLPQLSMGPNNARPNWNQLQQLVNQAAPQATQTQLSQWLNSRPNLAQLAKTSVVKTAVANSGLFLEQRLSMANVQTPSNGPANTNAQNTTEQDLKAILTKLIWLPDNHSLLSKGGAEQALRGLSEQLLQQIQWRQLQYLNQLQQTASESESDPTLTIDIPIRDGQQLNNLHIAMEYRYRDWPTERRSNEQEHDNNSENHERRQILVWHVEFSLTLARTGAIHAKFDLAETQLDTNLWAESQSTLKVMQQLLPQLHQQLQQVGFDVNQLACHPGAPPQTSKPLMRGLVDIKA